jgi:hypothetical protein
VGHQYRCDYSDCEHPGDWFNTVVYHLYYTASDEPPMPVLQRTRTFHWECLKRYMEEQ